MKNIIICIALTLSFGTLARSVAPHPDQADFKACTSGDMNLLGAATVAGNRALNEFIKTEVIEKEATCFVSKPRYFHPAVCGTAVTQIDTFNITVDDFNYTIVVDSSYRSCLRMRIIPMIKKFSYEPAPRPVNFP